MNPVACDTTPLIRILDEDVNAGPHTSFSPERRFVVRPSMVDPEVRLAVGNGILDSIQGAVATVVAHKAKIACLCPCPPLFDALVQGKPIRTSIGYDTYAAKTRGIGILYRENCAILSNRFYRAMHFSAKRDIAIACRLSVRPSVRM